LATKAAAMGVTISGTVSSISGMTTDGVMTTSAPTTSGGTTATSGAWSKFGLSTVGTLAALFSVLQF